MTRGGKQTRLRSRGWLGRAFVLGVATFSFASPAAADEPPASAPRRAGSSAQSARRAASTSPDQPAGAASGATETVALEIVAKAPKPIPPVELDMLQLRLMLTELEASFTSEIEKALFRDPF